MLRFAFIVALLPALSLGCVHSPRAALAPMQPVSNPLFVPGHEPEFLWNQLVDSLDDYFRIRSEERVRIADGVVSEGRIDTYPTVGSTIFEPWRSDSTVGNERLLSTLQSIRRFAEVRVVPTEGGYLVHLTVAKELEDLLQPEHATVGQGVVRHNEAFVRNDRGELENLGDKTLGWLPMGRDTQLEQRILNDLQARLATTEPIPPRPAGGIQ